MSYSALVGVCFNELRGGYCFHLSKAKGAIGHFYFTPRRNDTKGETGKENFETTTTTMTKIRCC